MVGVSSSTLKGLEKALVNLKEANNQFESLAFEDHSLKAIVHNRLYFKTTHLGKGKTLEHSKRVRIGYVIENMKGEVLFANCDAWMSTSELLPGLVHGIKGMQASEKRTIYLHPALGYGALTTLPPCIGLKINVHLIDFEENPTEALLPLAPLDFAWIEDPSFHRTIESSSDKIPTFTGSFYGNLFNKTQNAEAERLK